MAIRTGTASPTLLIATAKGAFFLMGNARRAHWKLSGPMLFGHIVNHVVRDPRDGQTLVAGARTGHLGPTVFRSQDAGDTWHEAKRPPAFRKARAGEEKRAVEHVFWLTPGTRRSHSPGIAVPSPTASSRAGTAGSRGDP